jgi:hypothetical protein
MPASGDAPVGTPSIVPIIGPDRIAVQSIGRRWRIAS